jgi:hypothetical protein
MVELDLERDPAHYVAHNLISEIAASSESDYDEDLVEEKAVTGPAVVEEWDGQMVRAKMEGYKRESRVKIDDLTELNVSTRVYDSPTDYFDKRWVSIEVEEPNPDQVDGHQDVQEEFYNQVKDDWNVEDTDKKREWETPSDSLILEYAYTW